MNPLRIGLLPLYLKFYDEVLPGLAAEVEPFAGTVAEALRGCGFSVTTAPVGRTREQFECAVRELTEAGVDVIATLHLAYSPSLESAPVLADCPLPVVMLDTTPDRDFGQTVNPARLMQNHGIHGVQDLASVLRRLGKPFRVVAGHLDDPAFLPRCEQALRAAVAARRLRGMRVLRIGERFPGMGDFAVPDAELLTGLGIRVDQISVATLSAAVAAVAPSELAEEAAADRARFQIECTPEVHDRSNRVGLGLRRYLRDHGYGAFSMNFLAFDSQDGPLDTVPFLECCKAMARGLGYAGEGDALTAALTGALLQGFGSASFTEIFCADWSGGSLFLSHMGEFNPALAAATPVLYEKEFPFTPALNPATLACAPQPGPATLVNLAPGPDGSFGLIAAPVEVLGDGTHPDLCQWVRGWIRPAAPLTRFLEEFSHHGGTHHSVLMAGDRLDAITDFGRHLGLPVYRID